MTFQNKDGAVIVENMITVIHENRDYLSEIDGAIGDGDHGVNMDKGFQMTKAELEAADSPTMSEAFKTLSGVLMSKIGGSMGPLYGNFFRGMAVASRDEDTIDEAVLLAMLKKALLNIQSISPAQAGDKTLLDVLIPAVEAYESAVSEGASMDEALLQMDAAADQGLEATKGMVAKMGRASRLGERSVGHQDAGATSCTILLHALSGSARKLGEDSK